MLNPGSCYFAVVPVTLDDAEVFWAALGGLTFAAAIRQAALSAVAALRRLGPGGDYNALHMRVEWDMVKTLTDQWQDREAPGWLSAWSRSWAPQQTLVATMKAAVMGALVPWVKVPQMPFGGLKGGSYVEGWTPPPPEASNKCRIHEAFWPNDRQRNRGRPVHGRMGPAEVSAHRVVPPGAFKNISWGFGVYFGPARLF